MRRHLARISTLIAGTLILGPASAQQMAPRNPAGQAAPAKPAARPPMTAEAQKAQREADLKAIQDMNPILAEWEVRSAKVTSLDVVFDKIKRSEGFGNEWFRGRAMLQSPDKACLQFTRYVLDADKKPVQLVGADGKKVAQLEPQPDERIVCTGAQVLQYDFGSKKMIVHPLDKQVRMKALQEGPLPFLFNMKAADTKSRYSMRLLKENETQYLIGIVPREEIDKQNFEQAFLWLSKKSFLPDQLWLMPVGGKDKEEYVFNGANDMILTNQVMDQKFFQFQKFDKWKVVVNEPDQPAPAAGSGAPAPVQPRPKATQTGTRPTDR